MNRVILIGRLTRDPEVRYAQNNLAVARYTLAVDRRIKDAKNEADFINCIAFGKSAEFAEKYLKQGLKLAVIGHIQTGSYTDKDGKKVYTTDVVVDESEFVEARKDNTSTAQNNTSVQQNNAPAAAPGFMAIPDGMGDEGLPFN